MFDVVVVVGVVGGRKVVGGGPWGYRLSFWEKRWEVS